MARERKQAEPEQEAGAPEWMVTFSDCMTLLLTFFVLLLTFSSFDEHVYSDLGAIFADAISLAPPKIERDRGAFWEPAEFLLLEDLDEGSEFKTLAGRDIGTQKSEIESNDFAKQKVFVIALKEVFLGEGTALSPRGREELATMALFLKAASNLVVISENGSGNQTDLGLRRACSVSHYFTGEMGLEKGRFSISSDSIIAQELLWREEKGNADGSRQRGLEIVVLERGTYK